VIGLQSNMDFGKVSISIQEKILARIFGQIAKMIRQPQLMAWPVMQTLVLVNHLSKQVGNINVFT